MPIIIVTSTFLLGFIILTFRYNWASVAPSNAITVVIYEVLKVDSFLTKLSPIHKCNVPIGVSCVFMAGIQVHLLKDDRESPEAVPCLVILLYVQYY